MSFFERKVFCHMKKLISILCALSLFCGICANALAYTAQCDEVYDFAGPRYGVSYIDTDGKVFVGVRAGKIAVSDDFQRWNIIKTDAVTAVEYLNGKFCAINKGYTLVSEDGRNWEKHDNNLPAAVQSIIKNKNSAVVFVEDYDVNSGRSGTGTYQSFDGITWNKVENIPEGAKMTIIGDKIFFASSAWLPGIYVSDTGESFEKLSIDGFEVQSGGMFMEYRDGEYVQNDLWRAIDDESNEYAYVSTDLKNWETKIVPRRQTYPHDSTYAVINGKSHQFTINGDDYVWEDGEWKSGPYNMGEPQNSDAANRPFVYYNVTESGIFAWSSNKNSYFLSNDGTLTTYNGSDRDIVNIYVEDGIFYAATNKTSDNDGITFTWQSADGTNWTNDADKKVTWDKLQNDAHSASNGDVTLESNIDIRGSRRNYEGNKNITGTLTYKDGSTAGVIFEDTKGIDYVRMFGGNGWFIMTDNDGKWYFSRDGITRGEQIDVPTATALIDTDAARIYSNGSRFIYFNTYDGTMYSGDMSQFDALSAPDAVRVRLNGEFLSFVNPPVIRGDRTLISVRFLFECMGATVDWEDGAVRTVTVTYGENTVKLVLDSDRAFVNGEEKILDVPAQLINEKTMIPLRFISEGLGFNVDYDETNKIAEITG